MKVEALENLKKCDGPNKEHVPELNTVQSSEKRLVQVSNKTDTPTETCPICGKAFYLNITRTKVFCSKKCADLSFYKGYKKRRKKTPKVLKKCPCCLKQYKAFRRTQTYCSRYCQSRGRRKPKLKLTCKHCRKKFESCKLKDFCSASCKQKRKSLTIVNTVYTCSICEKTFKSKNGRKRRTCSEKCRKKAKSIQRAEWRQDPDNREKEILRIKLYNSKIKIKISKIGNIKAEAANIKKALIASKTHKLKKLNNVVKRLRLFGKNTCCFCNKIKLEQNDQTLEHMVPISKGGTNSNYNLFFSCKDCNARKWSKNWKKWFREQEFYTKQREHEIEYYLDPKCKTPYTPIKDLITG